MITQVYMQRIYKTQRAVDIGLLNFVVIHIELMSSRVLHDYMYVKVMPMYLTGKAYFPSLSENIASPSCSCQ